MVSFTLSDARNQHGQVFDAATAEPILLTKNGRPSHVVMSACAYDAMTARLNELEDRLFAMQAEKVKATSQPVGADVFAAELGRLTNGAS